MTKKDKKRLLSLIMAATLCISGISYRENVKAADTAFSEDNIKLIIVIMTYFNYYLSINLIYIFV